MPSVAAVTLPVQDILLLVDGSGFLYRAFHALPALSTADGQPTGAIRGVLNMVLRLITLHNPARVALIFDAPGPTFRHAQYPHYKAHRPSMPDLLRLQIEPLQAVLRAEGFPLLIEAGVEADDVLGTLATQAANEQCHVLIASSDKDLTQLVQPFIRIFNPAQEKIYGVTEVQEKWGVPPQRFTEYLGLLGDASDNIPGVPGIGDKTARKLIQSYPSWEELLAHIESMSGKVGERLREHRQNLLLSRQLAQLQLQVPLPVCWQQLQRQPRDREALLHWYQRLEFKQELAALQRESRPSDELPPETGFAVTAGAVAEPENSPQVFNEITLEFLTVLRSWTTPVVVRLLQDPEGELSEGVLFVCQEHAVYLRQRSAASVSWRTELQEWFAEASVAKICEDSKLLRHWLGRCGWTLGGLFMDVRLTLYALDVRQPLDIGVQAARRCGWDNRWLDKTRKLSETEQLQKQQGLALATMTLADELFKELAQQPAVQQLLVELDLPVLQLLYKMEAHGALLSVAALRQQNTELSERIEQLKVNILQLAGEVFNPDSPQQLATILYDRLGLKVGRKTATGQRSTSEETLEQLVGQHPLPELCLEYRRLAKLRSTYTQKFPDLLRPETGRIHTTYNPTGTSTGRLSSSEPNLQNIPVRSAEGRRIRTAFIAPAGYQMMAADYSQIELRIMAHYSGDSGLLKAFSEGGDVHRTTAADIFGLREAEVTDAQRRAAKAINFGLIYGMSAFGLARQTGMSRNEAEGCIERYFLKYPGVQAYMENVRQQAIHQGYVETVLGRRLYVPDVSAMPVPQKAAVLRAAVNAPMQGSAADIMKKAMLAVAARLEAEQCSQVAMVLQVHDELVLEVPTESCVTVAGWVRQAMQQACQLRVPLEVACAWADNWGAAH